MMATTAFRRLAALAALLSLFLPIGLRSAEAGLPDLLERLKPSIVAIGTYQKTRGPPFIFRGTGFAVGDGTIIATAAHVLPDVLATDKGETMLILIRGPGKGEPQPREAKAIAVDKEHDVALLKIVGAPLSPVTLTSSSDGVRDGQGVGFTGFPFGNALGFYPVTHRGIIASIAPVSLPRASARELDAKAIQSLKADPISLFQLDATAYPGHSGSPLFDLETGEILGVVNMGFLKGGKDSAIGQPSGISFAIPIRHLRALIESPR